MTIDTRTGRPVIYICPKCESETRGLHNGMCAKCADRVRVFDGFVPVKWITREELLRQFPMAD